jgi:DNA-binding protein H-NS
VVESQKPATADDVLGEMRRETDAIRATSAKLLKELQQLLEAGRVLRARQEALLAQRRKTERGE